MRDNEIKSVTGQRSQVALNSYKNSSLLFKKVASARMLGSLRAGGATWQKENLNSKQLSITQHEANHDNYGQALILKTRNANQLVRQQPHSKRKLIFRKRQKPSREQDSEGDRRRQKNKLIFGKRTKLHHDDV